MQLKDVTTGPYILFNGMGMSIQDGGIRYMMILLKQCVTYFIPRAIYKIRKQF